LTAWQRIVDFVRRLLGMAPNNQKAFEQALVKYQEELKRHEDANDTYNKQLKEYDSIAPLKGTLDKYLKDLIADAEAKGLAMEQGESVTEAAEKVTPTNVGKQAMEILSGMGRDVKPPEPGYKEKIKQSWDNAKDNPKATAEAARDGFRRFSDQVQTWAFSSDAALNNQIRREIMGSMLGQEEKIGLLLNTSLSQTFHSDAIANLFLRMGDIKYNKELHKWEGVEDKNNFITLSQKLDEIGAKYGLDKAQIELAAHTAFEAKRTKSLIQFNKELEAQVQELRNAAAEERAKGNAVKASALSEKASELRQKEKFIHMDESQIRGGMTQFELMPELNDAVRSGTASVVTLLISWLSLDCGRRMRLSSS
jgi:hypothetical protein